MRTLALGSITGLQRTLALERALGHRSTIGFHRTSGLTVAIVFFQKASVGTTTMALAVEGLQFVL